MTIVAHPDLRNQLETVLQEAMQETQCRCVALIRRDGLVIASRLGRGSARFTAAATASIVGAAEMVAKELAEGDIEEIILSTKGGKIVSITAGSDAILVAVYDVHTNLGLALLALSQVARRIAGLLGNS